MTHHDKELAEPKPEEKLLEKLTVEQLKKPNFQPPKFKFVPPKAGKRHF